MNNDQKLLQGVADEIGDIALPEQWDFEDSGFADIVGMAKLMIDSVRKTILTAAKFETSEALAQSNLADDSLDAVNALQEQPDHADVLVDTALQGIPPELVDQDAVADAKEHLRERLDEPVEYTDELDREDYARKPQETLGEGHYGPDDFGGEDYPSDIPLPNPDFPLGAFNGAATVIDHPERIVVMDDGEGVEDRQEPSDAPDGTVIGNAAWLQGVENQAREMGLVAGKDYVLEYGIPGVHFDPAKEPNKLPPDHEDYTPF